MGNIPLKYTQQQKREDEVDADLEREAKVILDSTVLRISEIVADDTPITQGGFINTSVSSITVTADLGGGSPIEFVEIYRMSF